MRSIDSAFGITQDFAMGFGFGLMFIGFAFYIIGRNYRLTKKRKRNPDGTFN